ncbi:hypothetical protein [Microbacterium sp. SGAir0570]|uniref:hypothetical protein n=1 Tax=Microbacterium sp. SGAir0570 TaxID=2070348 RepID=UPI00215B6DA0|nr:hypothetical protein [Microbacterium sp. SGAir0570]
MSQNNTQQQSSTDATTEALFGVVKIVLALAFTVIFLPLAVPLLAVSLTGNRIAKRHWFWITHKWHPWVNTAAIVIAAAVLTAEIVALTGWITSGDARTFVQQDGWPLALVEWWWPFLLVNLLLGVLLLPVAWAWRRRQLAELVRNRKIPDVLTQEHIESARKRAADIVTARTLGLRLDSRTGSLTPLRGGSPIVAPHPVPAVRARNGAREKVTLQGIGMVERPTIRTFGDRMQDTRRVPDWTDDAGRYVVLPESAGAQRVLMFAESGSGKSVLLHDAILAVLELGWPVFFIDAKGDPDDAEKLAAVAAARGHSVLVGEPWNLFTGSAAEITTKLMRTLPGPPETGSSTTTRWNRYSTRSRASARSRACATCSLGSATSRQRTSAMGLSSRCSPRPSTSRARPGCSGCGTGCFWPSGRWSRTWRRRGGALRTAPRSSPSFRLLPPTEPRPPWAT